MITDEEVRLSKKSFDREKKRTKARTAPTGVRYNTLREGEGLVAFIAEKTVVPVKGRRKRKK